MTFRDQLVLWFLVVALVHVAVMTGIIADQQVRHRTRVPWLRRATANRVFIGVLISALLCSFAAALALPPKQYRVERTFDTVITKSVTTGRSTWHYVELVRGRDTVPYQVPVFCDMGAPYITYTRYMTSYLDSAQAVTSRLLAQPDLAYNTKCADRVISISATVTRSSRK